MPFMNQGQIAATAEVQAFILHHHYYYHAGLIEPLFTSPRSDFNFPKERVHLT